MPFSRYKVWIICMVMGFTLAIIATRDGVSATSGKRTTSAATKDRETHRLLTESPPDWSHLLLSQGANIEARNIQQETPLITSAGQGNLPLVQLLLQKHADIHAADADGNTPLHVASFYGRVKVVELLLNNGAKTRVQNSLGFSPLHQAVRRFWEVPGETEAGRTENQRQIVLLLLAHDADPALEDLSHRTAAILSTESNNAALAPLFEARSMSSGEQATSTSPAAPRPPLQQAPIDTPPPNEPEVRQQVEGTSAPENPREADSGKTDTAVGESQPIPPSSGPETEIVHPPDTNLSETIQPAESSDPSITAAGVPEIPTESIAKPVEPPTSAANAGDPETTTKPSSPSPPEESPAAPPAISEREQPRPSPPTMPQESAPAERTGSEVHQKPELSIQTPVTPPETSPPISPTLPGRRSEAEIPHTKAMPDLPKQKSAPAPQAPHTMDQPAPAVQKSDPLHASPPAATLPPLKRPEEIGALAQAANPREPILKSGQDIQPSLPGPVPGYPVKEPNQVDAKNGNRDRDQPPAKQSSDNWIFRNLGFGLGVGWTHNLGPERIESATAVNRVVRVDADQNDLVRFMPEVHLWMDQWWDDQRWNWGPFLSLAPGANLVDAIGFGLMLGYRPHQTDRYTFNLGIGGTLDFNTRVLGDGLTANQPLPPGENQVRTKQTTAPGLLIMLSVGWDIGMPRRSPPPQEAP